MRIYSDDYRYLRFIDGRREWWLSEHRLIAYSEGKLDHPQFVGCPLEVHHRNELKADNSPENLEPILPPEHGRITNGKGRSADG